MWKSDPATRISDERRSLERAGEPVATLALVSPRTRVRIARVPEYSRQALAQEGIVAGAEVVVERRVGLGGPIIVNLGRARIAIARGVAGEMEVEPVELAGPARRDPDGPPRTAR